MFTNVNNICNIDGGFNKLLTYLRGVIKLVKFKTCHLTKTETKIKFFSSDKNNEEYH